MIQDAEDRNRAVRGTDRSFVVEASAGTGKTRTLVDRVLHLVLCRGPEGPPIGLAGICAIALANAPTLPRNWSPSSFARRVAASTASIRVVRRPPASSVCRPAMAVPPGLVTWSFSSPGCLPVSMSRWAEPSTVWAASSWAVRRSRPTFTPASAGASMTRKM